MTEKRYGVCCPKGHRAGLTARRVVDYPVRAERDGSLRIREEEPYLRDARAVRGDPGITTGVHCAACDAWYREEEVVRPLRRGEPTDQEVEDDGLPRCEARGCEGELHEWERDADAMGRTLCVDCGACREELESDASRDRSRPFRS
jgi:hypothetical protein